LVPSEKKNGRAGRRAHPHPPSPHRHFVKKNLRRFKRSLGKGPRNDEDGLCNVGGRRLAVDRNILR
jgi:hypothetical protein